MRWTRGRIALLIFTLIVVIAAAALLWRKSTAPLVTRILPESQAILYFNLGPLRAATHFNRNPVQHDANYQHFIDSTGIDFERDLDEAAFALDSLPDPTGPNGGLAFSEVFAGHFDPQRLAHYLASIAASTETYDSRTIYNVPSDSRTVRVALLPHGMVVVSNTPTAEQIHSMLDRDRTAWLPGTGQPTLLTEHYRDLPVLSLAWGLGQVGLPFGDHGEFRVLGLTLPLRLDAVFIASLRWTGVLRLRIEQIAPNETAARTSASALSGLLSLGRLAENNLPASMANKDVQALLNSTAVTQHDDRAVVNATLPEPLLRSLFHTPGTSPR